MPALCRSILEKEYAAEGARARLIKYGGRLTNYSGCLTLCVSFEAFAFLLLGYLACVYKSRDGLRQCNEHWRNPNQSTLREATMAKPKGTHSRKKHTRQMIHYPQVKGKVVEDVEIDPDVETITILFEDKTALSFDIEPRLVVFPELANLKTGNWQSIKRWRALHSKPSMVSWP